MIPVISMHRQSGVGAVATRFMLSGD